MGPGRYHLIADEGAGPSAEPSLMTVEVSDQELLKKIAKLTDGNQRLAFMAMFRNGARDAIQQYFIEISKARRPDRVLRDVAVHSNTGAFRKAALKVAGQDPSIPDMYNRH
jgi:hypothetical protein